MTKNNLAIVGLGSGINISGSLVEGSKAIVQMVVTLLESEKADWAIFSGKWSWKLNFTPPLSEAEAMAKYAESLGCPKTKIKIEKNSTTTVSNLCQIKKILLKIGCSRVILVCNYPHHQRALYNLDKVLGPAYETKVIQTKYKYPEDQLEKIVEIEHTKLKEAKRFYKGIQDGDDATIAKLAMQEVERLISNHRLSN